jgi:hypothetical protein
MTLQEFIAKHGEAPPSMGRDNVYLPEFIEKTRQAVPSRREWVNDVVEYFQDPNAYLNLVRHLHCPNSEAL